MPAEQQTPQMQRAQKQLQQQQQVLHMVTVMHKHILVLSTNYYRHAQIYIHVQTTLQAWHV